MSTFFSDKKLSDEAESFDKYVIEEGRATEGSSALWNHGVRKIKRETDRDIALELIRIKQFVYPLVRAHGVPLPLTIRVATSSDLGGLTTGASRITGKGKNKDQVILLAADTYAKADVDKVLDIYAGTALHEAEHLLSSRQFFMWLNKMESAMTDPTHERFHELNEMKNRYNIIEDVRIENLLIDKSPGYIGYLEACRDFYFTEMVDNTIAKWGEKHPDFYPAKLPDGTPHPLMGKEHPKAGKPVLSPRAKAMSIIFFTLRCPLKMTEGMKEWGRKGIVPYEYMRAAEISLKTWIDVTKFENYVAALISFFSGEIEDLPLPKGYVKKPSAVDSRGSGSGTGSGTGEVREHGSGGKSIGGSGGGYASDKGFTKDELEDMKRERELEREVRKMESVTECDHEKEIEELSKRKAALEDKKDFEEAEKVEKEIEKVKEKSTGKSDKLKSLKAELEESFGYGDFEKATAMDEITESSVMSTGVRKEAESMEAEKFSVDKDGWKEGCYSGPKRKTATIEPELGVTEDIMFDALHKHCFHNIQKMRRVFSLRLADITKRSTDHRVGKLHRKKLATAVATGSDRVFYREHKTRAVGLDVVLLLDESGSMGSVSKSHFEGGKYKSDASSALEMAFCMQEALRTLPRTQLHIYSHHSWGHGHQNCLVKRFYSPTRPEPKALCGYIGGYQNYDHSAIEIVGEELLKNGKYSKKLFIVLSDGAPCGSGYGGSSAVQATKKAVQALERKGVFMLQIAISAAQPERMFTNYVKFTNVANMVPDISKLMQKLVLGAGRESY